jgi:hypothetical protein
MKAREGALKASRGVIGLPLKYYIGVDIRFIGGKSIVIVVDEKPPESEKMK